MEGGKELNIVSSFKVRKGCLTYLCGAHLLDRFSLRGGTYHNSFAELIRYFGRRLCLMHPSDPQPLQSNYFLQVFRKLLKDESFVDVTLVCPGEISGGGGEREKEKRHRNFNAVKAHKVASYSWCDHTVMPKLALHQPPRLAVIYIVLRRFIFS